MPEDVFGIVGRVVGQVFAVEEPVGEGGFGVVYRARHQTFRAQVALKCFKIPPGVATAAGGGCLERFRAEAEILFRVSALHPGIVRPLHAGDFLADDGRWVPFLALEWLEGATLDEFARRRQRLGAPLTLKRLLRLLEPIFGALEAAHTCAAEDGSGGIVHGDLKPQNLFVVAASAPGNEQARLLDFGCGGVLGELESCRHDGVLSRVFSPAYGAPEQWDPGRFGSVSPATDVWGLALTLVEILAGRPILAGDRAALRRLAIDPERRPTPRREGVVVSDEVEALFRRALAVDPRERIASVTELWCALRAAAGETRLVECAASGPRRVR